MMLKSSSTSFADELINKLKERIGVDQLLGEFELPASLADVNLS